MTCIKELNQPRYMSVNGIFTCYDKPMEVFDYNALKDDPLIEMTSRLEDYTSFAGKSEDASGSVKFIYKTGETVAAADVTAQTTADVQEGNFFTRLWQRIVNLFKF